MATSGLNYLIAVQIDQLKDLTKLHDTIVGIQQLSQKGAEFNVKVNASSLSALTREISNSVSKGFSNASANVGGGGGGGSSVSVDTTKLESSISRLAEVVGRMGTGGGGGVVPPPTRAPQSSRTNRLIAEMDSVIKLYDDVLAQRVDASKEQLNKLRYYLNKVSDPEAGPMGNRSDLAEFRQRLINRQSRLGGSVGTGYSGSGNAPTIAIDASVLKQAFESGAQQMNDALRKGIEDATAGLAKAITDAVIAGFGKTPESNFYRREQTSPGQDTSPLERMMSTMQAEKMQEILRQAPYSNAAGAYRTGARYVAGLSNRDRELFGEASNGGVMAMGEQYRQLMVPRVTNSAEVRRIEDDIAQLIRRREQARDERDKATTDKDRERFGTAFGGIQGQIDEKLLQKDGAIFAQLNKQIESASAQYRAFLADQRGKNVLTPDEYTKKVGALTYSEERIKSLRANNPNIEREMLLLPQALAQYIRDTMKSYVAQLKRYQETGQTIDQGLLDQIQSSKFLSNVAGRVPTTQRQAAGAVGRLEGWVKEFNQAKTAFEVVKGRAQLGLPVFNPNLDIGTSPFLPGEEDPGLRPREDRERYLKAFISRGGAFASQTEERRKYAEAELKKMQAQESAGTLGEAGQRRMLEFQREMEWGGRYYYTQSAFAKGGLIDNGALLTSGEAARVRAGEARSAVVGGSLEPTRAALSADAKAANDLYQAMGYVEGALQRVTRAIGDLSKANFDPVIKQFQELSNVLAPYAASLERVSKLVDANYGVKRAADAKVKQEAIEQAKSAGLADRLALAQSMGVSVGMPAFNVPGAGAQSSGTIPLISQDPATLRAMVTRGAKQIAGLQAKSQDLLSLEAAQLAAGIPSAATARRLGGMNAQYNATIGTFATNAAALAQADPRFFKGSSQDVIAASSGLLGAQSRTVQLGDEVRVLADAMKQYEQIQRELKKLEGNKTPAGELRRKSLTDVREQLIGARDASLDRLRNAGILQPGESSSNTAKVLDTLRAKQRELNAEVAKYSDLLLKSAESAVKAEMSGGDFPDRVISKFKNLSAYLVAGGILYTMSAQLRQASAAAIGLEADLARIQGVINSRSAGQTQVIGAGIMSGAMQYGTDLRQSVQAAKIFSQTGASPAQTVEMTKAALAAQVGAGIEAGQATELLIAVENITNRQVKSFDILDRISRIEAQYAVSAQDLSNAIQRAGSLATQLQPQALGAVDALDLIIGSATTIIERTRITGEQAATSLRFIISRLAAPEVSRSLQERFNIKLAGDDPNTLRPLQDILKDIADRYRALRESGQTVQAQQLLTTFAGARQSNVAAALLEGFDDAIRVASESSLAYGDTQERVRIQLDTVQAKLAQFNTAFTGFAATIFNDTGLAWMIKRLLDAGTGALETSQSSVGALGLGAGVLGGGLALRSGAGALLNLARGASGLGTAAYGVGATALGSLATGGVAVGGFLAVVGALSLAANALKKISEREDVRTSQPFDSKVFRESPFYQEFRERSIGFGLEPNELSGRFLDALTKVDAQVQAEVKAGRLRQDQSYNRTVSLLVKELDTTIPNFASMGTEAERTAAALALLRDSARFAAAIPNTYTNEYVKDLDDLLSEYDQAAPKLGEAMRKLVEKGFGTWSAVTTFEFEKINKQFKYRGKQFLDVPNLTASGTGQTFAQLVARNPGKELQTLDDYARQFLLVTRQERTRLEAAEAALRKENKEVNPLSVQGVLNADKNLSDSARQDLGLSYFRLGNLRDLRTQISQSLDVALGNDDNQRLNKLKDDLGNTLKEPGEVFARVIRDAVEDARKEMIARARAANMSEAGINKINEQFKRMNDSAARAAKDANVALTAMSVRDRLFEPIVGYGSRMAEIGTRQRVASRFGLNYDSVAAESQAAQELLVGLDQVPIRLLQDQIREAARLVNTTERGNVNRTVVLADDGGGGTGPAQLSAGEQLTGLLLNREDDIRKINDIAKNYITATTEGLAGFVDRGLASSDKQVREVTENLRKALEALAAFGSVKTKEDLAKLAELEGNLETQRQRAIEIVGAQIRAEVDRTRALRQITRDGQTATATAQFAGNRQQALLQRTLAEQQGSPLGVRDAADTQLELLRTQRDLRAEVARITRDTTLATLAKQPISDLRKQEEIDAQAIYNREIAAADSERALGGYGQVSQLNIQLARQRREEAIALTREVTSPLAELLQSPRNFSREGYEKAVSGVASAFQNRMIDVFMQSVFSETGAMGNTIIGAFENGALSTETAIQRGFRASLVELEATLSRQVGAAVTVPQTMNDGVVPPGYGKRLLVTPDGTYALNNKDAVMAGPNLVAKPADDLRSSGGRTQLLPFGKLTPDDPPVNPIKPYQLPAQTISAQAPSFEELLASGRITRSAITGMYRRLSDDEFRARTEPMQATMRPLSAAEWDANRLEDATTRETFAGRQRAVDAVMANATSRNDVLGAAARIASVLGGVEAVKGGMGLREVYRSGGTDGKAALAMGLLAVGVPETGPIGSKFYSRLGRAIEAAPFEKGTPQQWRAALSKSVSEGERDFVGISDYLNNTMAKTLTKADVQRVFNDYQVQLTETVYSTQNQKRLKDLLAARELELAQPIRPLEDQIDVRVSELADLHKYEEWKKGIFALKRKNGLRIAPKNADFFARMFRPYRRPYRQNQAIVDDEYGVLQEASDNLEFEELSSIDDIASDMGTRISDKANTQYGVVLAELNDILSQFPLKQLDLDSNLSIRDTALIDTDAIDTDAFVGSTGGIAESLYVQGNRLRETFEGDDALQKLFAARSAMYRSNSAELRGLRHEVDRQAPAYVQYTQRNQFPEESDNLDYKEILLQLDEFKRFKKPGMFEGSSPLAAAPYPYRTNHFNEHNILAHLRINAIKPQFAENPWLFLEEMQSDWHQAGRKHGYSKKSWSIMGNGEVIDSDIRITDMDESSDRNVPYGPFSKTEEWTELALKRLFIEAAEGNYEKVMLPFGADIAKIPGMSLLKKAQSIGWRQSERGAEYITLTSGDAINPFWHQRGFDEQFQEKIYTIAEDYPISKLPFFFNNDKLAGNIQELIANGITDSRMLPENLRYAKTVYSAGGELAPEMKIDPELHGSSSFVLGDQGMREYYDVALPRVFKNYMKTLGLPSVLSDVSIPIGGRVGPGPEAPILRGRAFDVTEEFRKAVLSGQRLLGVGGLVGLGAANGGFASYLSEENRRNPRPVNDVAMGPGSGRVITGPEGSFSLNPQDNILAGTDLFRDLNAQIQQIQQLAMLFSQLARSMDNQNLTDLTSRLDEQVFALGGVAAGGNGAEDSAPSTAGNRRYGGWRGAANAAMPLVGSLVGGNLGGKDSFSAEGAQILSGLGTTAFGPVGGLIGGLAGGLLGGLFKKKMPEPERQMSALQKIEANTRQQIDAIENQTRMLTLDSRFMNVPTGFTVPGFRPFGVGGGGDVNLTVNITGSSGDPEETAALVSDAIRRELRGLGTSYNVLNN